MYIYIYIYTHSSRTQHSPHRETQTTLIYTQNELMHINSAKSDNSKLFYVFAQPCSGSNTQHGPHRETQTSQLHSTQYALNKITIINQHNCINKLINKQAQQHIITHDKQYALHATDMLYTEHCICVHTARF